MRNNIPISIENIYIFLFYLVNKLYLVLYSFRLNYILFCFKRLCLNLASTFKNLSSFKVLDCKYYRKLNLEKFFKTRL